MALIKKFRIKKFKEQKPLLRLEKISMFYNKRQILNDLNLKINKQEIFGMLGQNDVGKSTIFNIITGLKDPSFGKVLINGNHHYALVKYRSEYFDTSLELISENAILKIRLQEWITLN